MAMAADHGLEKTFYTRSQRQRLNLVPALLSLFVPWIFFCLIYALLSFSLQYKSPEVCNTLMWLSFAAVMAACALAMFKSMTRNMDDKQDREPNWLTFIALTSLAGWIVAVVLGRLNYQSFMHPYYDYIDLNTYTGVDPARMRGQQMMDAGRVQFANDVIIDVKRSMGFKNLDTYCVAPITLRGLPLQTYDFWAVGLGCCSANGADFHCGEYDNPAARSGLRMLDDDHRPFFRLAVQQAESQFNIKADHPLFFFWGSDATAEMNSSQKEGVKWFLIGMIVHFGWQFLCVVLALAAFGKLSRTPL